MNLAKSIAEAAPQNFWISIAISSLLTLLCFYLIFRFLHRCRIIADTPTSKIRSAAQGYTELEGKAELMPGASIFAPLTGELCPWYSFKIEKRTQQSDGKHHKTHWDTIEQGISDALFQLRDETGVCIIDPDSADVTPSVSLTWYGHFRRPASWTDSNSLTNSLFSSGDYRYTERRIQPGDELFAIGDFISSDGYNNLQTTREEIRDLLNTWKRDQSYLLKKFDANNDGEINMQEWGKAHTHAEKEVLASRQKQAVQTQFHVLKKPSNSRHPFILSTVLQHKLIFNYRLYTGLSAIAFLYLGAFVSWALAIRYA